RRLRLEGADVDGAVDDPRLAALVGGRGTGPAAGVEGRAAGQQGVGPGGAAVVLEGAQAGVNARGGGTHLVTRAAEAAATGAVADQVMAVAAEGAGQVGVERARADVAGRVEVAGDQAVGEFAEAHRPTEGAAAVARAGGGAVGDVRGEGRLAHLGP